MSSPRLPNSFSSSYRKVEDAESWDFLKPVNQNGSLARRFFPGYRIAFFAVSGLYVISMFIASVMIAQPALFRRSPESSSIVPDGTLNYSTCWRNLQADVYVVPRDQTVVFNGYVDFEVERTKDDAWSKLIPRKPDYLYCVVCYLLTAVSLVVGRGFVEMPVEIPLEDGGVKVKNEYFCISMFHQLHCIVSILLIVHPKVILTAILCRRVSSQPSRA